MSAASSLGLNSCFADPDAVVPRVAELGVTSASAVPEPRAASTATTAFPRLLDGTAFAAFRPDGRRPRGSWYLYVGIGRRNERGNAYNSHHLAMQLHAFDLELTFARRHAIRPPVINIFAAKSSAVLEPSTARSATTDSA